MFTSPWLANARFDGGLLFPGSPHRHAADLHLGPDRVRLVASATAAELEWSAFLPPRRVDPVRGGYLRREVDAWWLGPYGANRAGPFGVVVRASGSSAGAVELVSETTAGLWNGVHNVDREVQVPCWAGGRLVAGRDYFGTCALVEFLAGRPRARDRLTDRAAVTELLLALHTRPLRVPVSPPMPGRTGVEILGALKGLGYVHVAGRPMPGDPLPAIGPLTTAVMDQIERNPWCRDLEVSEETVARIVRRRYLDVEPWPFEALLS